MCNELHHRRETCSIGNTNFYYGHQAHFCLLWVLSLITDLKEDNILIILDSLLSLLLQRKRKFSSKPAYCKISLAMKRSFNLLFVFPERQVWTQETSGELSPCSWPHIYSGNKRGIVPFFWNCILQITEFLRQHWLFGTVRTFVQYSSWKSTA